jgi:hypothetical protein
LEFCVCFAQVVEQARQLSVIFPLEATSELLRAASHTQEMYNERLIRVGEDLSGVHGSVSLSRSAVSGGRKSPVESGTVVS